MWEEMMNARISKQEVLLLALPLPQPFRLGFGVLHQLPRVLLVLDVENEQGRIRRSVGEASIDFPFSHYDAWDIVHALSETSLVGRSVFDRERILQDVWKDRELDHIYAAHAALNMALDDACAAAQGISVSSFYGTVRTSGRILESIGIPDHEEVFDAMIKRMIAHKRVPKIKCDEDVDSSRGRLVRAMHMAAEADTYIAADFNATLEPEQWNVFLKHLRRHPDFSRLLFVEQPTREGFGMQGIREAARLSQALHGPMIVADESFVSKTDAIACGENQIGMNMKIQKVGGLRAACILEKAAEHASRTHGIFSMVGGTFPTALGRVYDQHAAFVLKSATLPSDGWQPATDWFTGPLHLIQESFEEAKPGYASQPSGTGLGCTPNWKHIQSFVVNDAREEYRRIRETGKGTHLVIHTEKTHEPYAVMYERLSGRNPFWNL